MTRILNAMIIMYGYPFAWFVFFDQMFENREHMRMHIQSPGNPTKLKIISWRLTVGVLKTPVEVGDAFETHHGSNLRYSVFPDRQQLKCLF